LNPRYANAGSAKVVDNNAFRKIGRLVRFDNFSWLVVLLTEVVFYLQVADTIGASEQIFVEDAALGAHRLAETKVRAITNNANVNLYLRHALSRSPIGDIRQFGEDLVAYIAPNFSIESAGGLGISGKSFAVINLDRKTLVMGGTNQSGALRTALTAFAANRMLLDDFPSIVLNAHLVSDAAGKSAFVLDPARQLVSPVRFKCLT